MCYITVFRMFAAAHGYAGTFVPQCQEKNLQFSQMTNISVCKKSLNLNFICPVQVLYVKLRLFLVLLEKRTSGFMAFYRLIAYRWRSFTSRRARLLFEISVSADARQRDNRKVGL